MKLAGKARIKGEGVIAFLVIVLLVLGGIVWWLYASRRDAEKNARLFAMEVTRKIAINYDEKYLHVNLSPSGQAQYLQSFRDRLIDRLRERGVPAEPIDVQGDVVFTKGFFDPRGLFRAQLKYPETTAQLELGICRGMTVWQVEMINLIYSALPTPTPGPTPVMTPTPTPGPEQKAKPKR